MYGVQVIVTRRLTNPHPIEEVLVQLPDGCTTTRRCTVDGRVEVVTITGSASVGPVVEELLRAVFPEALFQPAAPVQGED